MRTFNALVTSVADLSRVAVRVGVALVGRAVRHRAAVVLAGIAALFLDVAPVVAAADVLLLGAGGRRVVLVELELRAPALGVARRVVGAHLLAQNQEAFCGSG